MNIFKRSKFKRLVIIFVLIAVIISLPQFILRLIILNPNPESLTQIWRYEELIYLFGWSFETWFLLGQISYIVLFVLFVYFYFRSKLLSDFLKGVPITLFKGKLHLTFKKKRDRYSILVESAKKYAFFQVVGIIAAIIAVITFHNEVQDRKKQKHYQAWQVIYQAEGKKSQGGRNQALMELNEDNISLMGIDLSGGTSLEGINLSKADLRESNLSNSNLQGINLYKANLWKAKLINADLSVANLKKAHLYSANLSQSTIYYAQLNECNMEKAELVNAILNEAELVSVNLKEANFYGSSLTGANLRYANLESIKNWNEIKEIKLANLYGVKNPPDDFVKWAIETMGAVSVESDSDWRKQVWDFLHGPKAKPNRPSK